MSMSSRARRPTPAMQPAIFTPDKRKLRWNGRFKTWTITDRATGQPRNINREMARAYAAAGIGIEEMRE